MKKKKFLKILPSLLSAIALLAVASCSPVPYNPQGIPYDGRNIAGYDGENGARGSDLRDNSGRGASAYQEEQLRENNQSLNSTRTYTPPSERPSYTPPPRRPSYTTPSTPQSTYRPPIPRLPEAPSRTSTGKIPPAVATTDPNKVISPYAPYNLIDIAGYSAGAKLCDPSTIPIDPATGKQYIDPATGLKDAKRGKYFIVPNLPNARAR